MDEIKDADDRVIMAQWRLIITIAIAAFLQVTLAELLSPDRVASVRLFGVSAAGRSTSAVTSSRGGVSPVASVAEQRQENAGEPRFVAISVAPRRLQDLSLIHI